MTYFTPPLMVPKKVADIYIVFTEDRWHLTIHTPDRNVCWSAVPGSGPGVLLNAALGWATDRGLNIHFVAADITKQVPREEGGA